MPAVSTVIARVLACRGVVNDGFVEHVTCLGCGCACDDVALRLSAGRIVEAGNACELGATWFGDGVVPALTCVDGHDVPREEALDRAAALMAGAVRPLVYLAPDISSDAQREAIALADTLHAVVDSVTSATALPFVLAAQERGQAGATLGEVRNRADVVVFWGVDSGGRYPRFHARYAPDAVGLHVPLGRRSRRVVAIDVGQARGPADADLRLSMSPADEVATLTRLASATGLSNDLHAVATVLREGRYVAVVADAEPDQNEPRDPGRAAALLALTQALNGSTRCALILLRAGGNRCGADAALTAQTGYPLAVDFTRGYPRYRPHDGTATLRLDAGEVDAVLVVGAVAKVPADVRASIERVPGVVIGPLASSSARAGRGVAIDTGVPGIHERGGALRMDDVPLPLRAVVSGPPGTAETVRDLGQRLQHAAPRPLADGRAMVDG